MKQNLTEVARFQQLAGIKNYQIIKEEESEVSVPDEVSKAANVFDLKAIKAQAKEKSEKLDESILAGIGIILAIPALLQGFATLIEKGKRLYSGISKEEIEKIKAHNIAVAKGKIKGHKKYTSETSKEIDEFAHKLHSIFVKPIEGVLWVLSKIPGIGRIKYIKDEEKRHKLAEAFYLLAAMAIGGWGLVSHAVGVTTAIDAIKLGDVAIDASALATTSELVKDGPEFLLKLVA